MLTGSRLINAAHRNVERPDLLIHALAQLPDNVALNLSSATPDRQRIELLVHGYGISDRVNFEAVPDGGATLRIPPTMAELIHEFSDPSDPPAACREQDESLAGQRVAVVTNLPAPYRLPLLGKMSQRLRRAGAEFRVFFAGSTSRGRPWIGVKRESNFRLRVSYESGAPHRGSSLATSPQPRAPSDRLPPHDRGRRKSLAPCRRARGAIRAKKKCRIRHLERRNIGKVHIRKSPSPSSA